MPHPDILEKYLRFPITCVPDTTKRNENYARHHEVDIESQLPKVGISPEFLYQAKRYQDCIYSEGMKKAVQQRAKIKEILNTCRDENHKIKAEEEYWPCSVFCSKCNKDTTKIVDYDGEYNITYTCDCGNKETKDMRKFGGFKLGWRVDWPMRWNEEKVIFEPGGKDHISPGGSYDTAKLISKNIYDFPAPITMRYDFVKLKGVPGKMSSSKGKVIALQDALQVYQSEVLRYIFAGTRPNTEFAISFDLDVVKVYEDYDKTERIAWGKEQAKSQEVFQKEKRIYELSQIKDSLPSIMPYQIGFRQLTTFLQIYSGNIDAVLASFEDLKEEQVPTLKNRLECAWYWITECAPTFAPDFCFSLRVDHSKATLDAVETKAMKRIYSEIIPKLETYKTDKDLQQALYDIAKEEGMEAKALFTALYQALIAKDKGPRLASFMKIIGKDTLKNILSVY